MEGLTRELKEELGLRLSCGPLCAVVETGFINGDVKIEEIGLYFLVDPHGIPDGRFRPFQDEARLEFNWFRTEEMNQIDVRPKQIGEILTSPDVHITHLIQKPAD